MKHLVIYCHPNPKSFNNAIRQAFVTALKENKQEVKIRDLYELNFQSVLMPSDFEALQKGLVSKDIAVEQDNIKWADIITFIHPIWWASMPARLKGYIDRVFTFGFAYKIDSSGVKGLLTGKKVLIINTTGTPDEIYSASGMFKSLTQTISDGTFRFCGLEVIEQKFFAGVPSATDEARKKMLQQVRELAEKVCG